MSFKIILSEIFQNIHPFSHCNCDMSNVSISFHRCNRINYRIYYNFNPDYTKIIRYRSKNHAHIYDSSKVFPGTLLVKSYKEATRLWRSQV